MKRLTIFFCLLASCSICSAQDAGTTIDDCYHKLRRSFQEQNAYTTVAYVEQRWRLAGNTGFNESIRYVEKILQQAGFKQEVNGEADGVLTYRLENRKMNHPAWEPLAAEVTFAGEKIPLLEYKTNRNMMAINSASTNESGVTAEVVNVGSGSRSEFERRNVKGKIVFAESNARNIYDLAMQRGAIGVFAYSMPKYTQPSKHVNSIQFQSIPLSNPADQKWAILLSYAAREKLKTALAKGKVMATVKTTTRIFPSEELTLVANVRGATKADERFVFSAHVQEPGANDNATGVGTLAEMARVTASLVLENAFTPGRTITFLWGDEIVSTRRYITDDAARAKGIKWGLSLDMVGEDVSKTGGSFLIEKMPDPSAIWTRGKEKHTEWGGEQMKESQMFPHYFNDVLLNRCRQQASENGWIVNTNPFEGGSDHTPFLDANIPGLLMWHFTDVFYHTDADRLDMVSAKEMRNVGISALATAFILTSATEKITLHLIDEVMANGLDRLDTEADLGRKAIVSGSSVKTERHILEVWTDWYNKAIEKMSDICVSGPTESINQKIASAQRRIKERNQTNSLTFDRKTAK